MLALKHATFGPEATSPRFYWGLKGVLRDFESIRRQAEAFAGEIGKVKLDPADEFFEPASYH